MKTLVLVGSGEFTESMIETDKYLLSKIKKPANVVIIPTASVPDGKQQKWIDDGIKHFKKLGTNPFGINIENREDAEKKVFLDKLKNADFIYFSGGHPGFLFKVFAGTKAWELILDLYNKGVILVGSSAGAMIMGKYLLGNAQESFDQGVKPKWIKGFGLVPNTILPHYDWALKNKSKDLKRVLGLAPEAVRKNWIGIDEDTALLICDKMSNKIFGKGRITYG